ncbi:MAG: DUF4230 domain-containing protein [Fimbriimonadaceae bacterium]|nr:DUF4230 domain-containing protein [Fimbriimonadaceae bacterium]
MKQRRGFRFLPWLAVLSVLAVGFSLGRIGQSTKTITPAPVVLQQVRSLGELHLVEHKYQTVMTMESHRDAAEWTQGVPMLSNFVSGAVEAATKNEALVTVTGSVEAGIDMSQASIIQSADKVVVTLPQPKIYPANVDAQLHSQKRAIGWDDRNLGLKARREGANRFEAASLKAGILSQAKSEAKDQVVDLFKSAGVNSVEIRFLD